MARGIPLLAALLAVVAGVTLVPAAWAHPGHASHAGQPVVVTQAVGPYQLRATVEPPDGGSGPIMVDVRASEDLPGGADLEVSVARLGAEEGIQRGAARMYADDPGPYSFRFAAERPGTWELRIGARGEAGSGFATVPFEVVTPERSLVSYVLAGSLATLGGLLLALTCVVALDGRGGRKPVARWVPLGIAQGAAICLAVAATAGIQVVLTPAADRYPGATPSGYGTTSRPHVNGLLETEPAAPRAGEPLRVGLDLVDGATGRPVDDLVPHHEALVHAVVVSDDGGYFAHIHPARTAPGHYEIGLTPDRPGRYSVYAEVARRDSGTQVVERTMTVGDGGTAGARGEVRGSAAPLLGTHDLAGLRVEATSMGGEIVRAGEPTALLFRITKEGRPVTDLEPWLGMPGHLIVRSEDGSVFGHVHAAGSMTPSAGGSLSAGSVPGATSAQSGPDLQFGYTFPEAGEYRVWLQFKREGEVMTLPMQVQARPTMEAK